MSRSARLALANMAGGIASYASKKLKVGRGETITGRVILAIDRKAIS